jgi:hypothetical protein
MVGALATIGTVDDSDVITEVSAGDGVDTANASATFTLSQFVDNLVLTGSGTPMELETATPTRSLKYGVNQLTGPVATTVSMAVPAATTCSAYR